MWAQVESQAWNKVLSVVQSVHVLMIPVAQERLGCTENEYGYLHPGKCYIVVYIKNAKSF